MRSSLRFLNLTLLWRTHHFWSFVILVFCDVAIFRGCLWTGQTNKTLPPVFRLPPGNHHLGPPDHIWSKTTPYDARPDQTVWCQTRPYDAKPTRPQCCTPDHSKRQDQSRNHHCGSPDHMIPDKTLRAQSFVWDRTVWKVAVLIKACWLCVKLFSLANSVLG